ncbi:hypothetical protein BFP76_02045 [Amylibacter kogurei]|uniref:HAD family hydrolase n=1 Tax=Paramylibacter kogurei TaxID=1889778 RepID=A0A2G5K4U9_9RHOB|nr:HAD family hydrolase [Amylibacter kogurei]PIB24052.1 hypothetical protein BFP76_02045 [Amylibacter kogurei]
MITHVCFDADDTLWEEGKFFIAAEFVLADVLAKYAPNEDIADILLGVERANVPTLGYGVKSYTLSLIEAALKISDYQISAEEIARVMDAGRAILRHPMEMPEGLVDVLTSLRKSYKLVVITKGDLVDQNHKLDRSNLREYFDEIHVVIEKDAPKYTEIFDGFDVAPEQCLMIGNSMKSDVVPAIDAGGWGVYLPHTVTWQLESADEPVDAPKYRRLKHISELPALLAELNKTPV